MSERLTSVHFPVAWGCWVIKRDMDLMVRNSNRAYGSYVIFLESWKLT